MVLKGNAQNAVYMCVWINFVRSNNFSRFGKLKQDIQNYIIQFNISFCRKLHTHTHIHGTREISVTVLWWAHYTHLQIRKVGHY